jgi:hypothetical protein
MKRWLALLISAGVTAFTLIAVLAVAAPRLIAAPPASAVAPEVIVMTATPPPASESSSGEGEGLFSGSFSDDESGEGGEREDEEHEDAEVEFKGVVEEMTTDALIVSGQTLFITERSKIKRGIGVGSRVKVHAWRQADGSLVAKEIEWDD